MTPAPEGYARGFTLAPMAGFTDSAFRTIARRHGATAVVTEMVSVQGLSRRNSGSCRLLAFREEEKPIGVQLYGAEPEAFERAASIVSRMGFDFIDINAGCPVRKVLASRSGAALLRDIPRLLDVVSATSAGAGGLPVTLKIRLGWDPENPVPDDIGALAASRGASALCVHGRFRSDMFDGPVRTAGIAAIAGASPIPVVANGDSTSPSAALRMRDETGASGLLIGRGAIGRPWFFRELAGLGSIQPAAGEFRETVMEHLRLSMLDVPAPFVFHMFRGQLVRYLKGFKGAASLRSLAVGVESESDVAGVLEEASRIMETA